MAGIINREAIANKCFKASGLIGVIGAETLASWDPNQQRSHGRILEATGRLIGTLGYKIMPPLELTDSSSKEMGGE